MMTTDGHNTFTSIHTRINGNVSNTKFNGMERILLTANGNLQRTVSAFYDTPVNVDILQNSRQCNDKDLPAKFNRKVELSVTSKDGKCKIPFGIAITQLELCDPEYLSMFLSVNPGLGQFFDYFCIRPYLNLLRCGYGIPPMFINDLCQDDSDYISNPDLYKFYQPSTKDNVISDRFNTLIDEWNTSGGTFWRIYRLHSLPNADKKSPLGDKFSCIILEVLRKDVFDLRI
jgi:hypothetical protein